MHKYLKKSRVIVSLFIFIAFVLYFIDDYELLPQHLISWSTDIQFVPALLKAISASVVSIVILGVLIALTVLFGRVYCSTICPLGIFQDIVIRIKKRYRPKFKFKFKKANNVLRYTLLALTALLLIIGVIELLILLDPYSNFGRILTDVIKPPVLWLNNIIARLFQKANLYWLSTISYKVVWTYFL
jgi:polyferredoxin